MARIDILAIWNVAANFDPWSGIHDPGGPWIADQVRNDIQITPPAGWTSAATSAAGWRCQRGARCPRGVGDHTESYQLYNQLYNQLLNWSW